jgi:DNA-binding NarL/FixJ family response regulator
MGPIRVMVVDDASDARFLIGLVLGDADDIEVVADTDGAASALAALADAAPDVALVDARMPAVDGFELAPQLLARAPGLRVALLTSMVDSVIEGRARDAGAQACLSKGDLDGLPAAVRALAGR